MSDQPEHPLEKILRENAPKDCTICGGEPKHIGLLLPNEEFARIVGATQGTTRLIAYALCDTCVQLPDRHVRVTKEVLAHFDKLNQRHANG